MGENKESTSDIIENLALVTDAMQTMFPEGKIICVYELNNEDFKKVQNHFRKLDHQHKRFSIDISGLEHVFIHEGDILFEKNFEEEVEKQEETPEQNEEEKPEQNEEEKPEQKQEEKYFVKLKKKISSWFISGRSSVK